MITLPQTLALLTEETLPYRSYFPVPIASLADLRHSFSDRLARMEQESLKLSIAIMGQVKAGKSSFLNALLFDGKEVLPTAATPKTANLTRISYGQKPQLTITYYSLNEWNDILKDPKIGNDSLAMVQQHGVNAEEVLTQNNTVFEADSIEALMHHLNDYVGENGRYTALVKATDITLPLEELKGFDVVDTPGMNDPVPSRTQKTREYMAQCDVVFFLSRCSQFLDQSDMDLLANQLPSNGVKRMVLVAGQFDGAISDDGWDRKSLSATKANLTQRLLRRADTEIEKLASARESVGSGYQSTIPAMLRTLKNPIFASTFAHGFAEWEPASWSNSMQHAHAELQDMAQTQWNYTFTLEDWQRIGNFPALQAAYHSAREAKKIILQEQRDRLLPETEHELQRRLHTLTQAIKTRQQQLTQGDLRDLEQRIDACQARMGNIVQSLTRVIDRIKTDCASAQTAAHQAVRDAAKHTTQLNTRTGTNYEKVAEEEAYQVQHSQCIEDNGFTNLWGLFSNRYRTERWTTTEYRTVYRTITSNYEYIETADAIEKLVNFGRNSAAQMERQFHTIVHLANLRADMKTALVNALNTLDTLDNSADYFDPQEFRSIFDSTLEKLHLPTLKIKLGDIESMISRRFSGSVQGNSQMKSLQKAQQEAVQSLQDNLLRSFDSAADTLQKALQATSESLTTQLSRDLQSEREQLQRAFADKENELTQCANLLAKLEKSKIKN